MAKREHLLRLKEIVNYLNKQKEATFEEISGRLERVSEWTGDDLRISLRTFQRDINQIRDFFKKDIRYNRSAKTYSIAEEEEDKSSEKLMEVFDMANFVRMVDRLPENIMFDRNCQKGTEHLLGLLHSVKHNFKIKIIYHPYTSDNDLEKELEPYAMKEYKGRWYLLAKDLEENDLRTFAIDRIKMIDISVKHYDKNNVVNAEEYFRDCFGIIRPNKGKAENVILSFDPEQGKYIKSFPLHHSQEIIIDNDKEYRIKLKVFIEYDFKKELLSMIDRVRIIEPEKLKDDIKNCLKTAIGH